MIREYINELMIENNEKLNDLDQQLKSLINDLDSATEWMEKLQAEMNIDKNIFSPRSNYDDLKGKAEDAQNNIKKINQEIEYVRSFTEEHLKKKEEYKKLLEELDDMSCQESKKDESSLSIDFLSKIYKKTEQCLALLYSDRNKCKSELKDMKIMIKNTAESLSIANDKKI